MERLESAVEVAVRVRPLIDSELARGCREVLEVIQNVQQVRIKDTEKAFTYNYVFGPAVLQETVYSQAVERKVKELFGGYNVTILAYGQTGSGKTHSMGTTYDGTGDMGIIPRCIQEIYSICKDNFSYDFTVTVSFMELYQEVLYDLLAERPRDQCTVDIREDNRGIIVPGLTEMTASCASEALKFLAKGSLGRATSSTNMNSQSSRSHAIFTVNIGMQHKKESNLNKTAKFHLVDLAGSERPKKTGATGQTFREGVNINKGLLVLGNVISALGDEKQQHSHIPYRDSNLTRLLKDSLGGNSITLMIACVSPADYNLDETMSTLRYADRARKIKNKPVVNQDPKSAEINRLNKLVQQLRLELVGQGGPIICQAELELLKSQNEVLKTKNVDLTTQLSSTLSAHTALMEKLLFMQSANEKLTEKLHELKDQYDLTLNNLNLSLDNNDVIAIKENITKLQNIQLQFTEIDKEQKTNEEQMRIREVNSFNGSRSNTSLDLATESEINEKQECHTAQQVALNAELQELMKQLALKEHLAQQLASNNAYMVDYNAIAEHESKIALLEKQKEELLQHLRNATTVGPTNKLAEQRRKQVQELETRIVELKKKVQEQARLIKLKEKDELKIKQLNSEILQMKQTRVKLIRAMKQESEQFRSWRLQKEREMHKLKEQDRKRQNQMIKMETMHSRQQNVLKRKVEEVAAVNKRLKEALAVRKAAQEMRKTGKVEKVGSWIQHELEVYINIMQAQATLQSLMDDRANLNEQMTHLKAHPELSDEQQIGRLEEDIELRSIQIADLQQKILDSDEENRAKTRFDSVQSMSEAKHALKTLFELAGEKKVTGATQILELQHENSELKAQNKQLESRLKVEKLNFAEQHANELKEYEEKISLLLHQLRGMECKSGDEDLQKRCQIQQETIERLENQIQDLSEKLTLISDVAIEKQTPSTVANRITKSRSEERKPEVIDVDMENTPQKPDKKILYIDSPDIDEDNVDKDPDWRKTPLAKRLTYVNRIRPVINNDQEAPRAVKRTSEGGCTCKKNCSTRTCGCRKNSKNCSASCKCIVENCANRSDSDGNYKLIEETPYDDSTEKSQDEEKDVTFIEPVDPPKRKKLGKLKLFV